MKWKARIIATQAGNNSPGTVPAQCLLPTNSGPYSATNLSRCRFLSILYETSLKLPCCPISCLRARSLMQPFYALRFFAQCRLDIWLKNLIFRYRHWHQSHQSAWPQLNFVQNTPIGRPFTVCILLFAFSIPGFRLADPEGFAIIVGCKKTKNRPCRNCGNC